MDIEDAIASFTVRHFSLQFGCFRSSGGISGTTSLYSRTNCKNCSKTTRSIRSNEICWVRCLSLDNDSHNSGSFLSSPLSPAVPKFNDNKPGNLYNSNYLVYYHVILFFNTLVTAYLLFSCSFFITICLLVCLVCFIKIYRIVLRHQLQIHVQQQALENSTDSNKQQIQKTTKNAKNIFIYFLVMILFYTPLFFVHIFSAINNLNSRILLTFPVTLAFMNSSINPFLYCCRNTRAPNGSF